MSNFPTFAEVYRSRSTENLRQLSHIKRFMERLVADPTFRWKLAQHIDDPQVVAAEYGINVDPMQMLPLFSSEHMKYRGTEAEAQWPLSLLWTTYIKDVIAHRDELFRHGAQQKHAAFGVWRRRQVQRCLSELGASAGSITHPLVAYELSDGCSVGCWFCGISADRFRGHLPYTAETAELWRGVVQYMSDTFGAAAQTGFCYWATDPMDNPDYDKFIADHYKITGFLPQTTTAAPLKDVALTRRVLALFNEHQHVINRFSVISLKLLDRVHAEFSPEELFGVELVTQNREALMAKANAGRARERRQKLRKAGKDDRIAERDDDHSTIACVSGFLVNLPNRTVRMVAPTRAGDRWPLGYRVFEEAWFADAQEFARVVDEMMARHCYSELRSSDRLVFRDDLTVELIDDGFRVRSSTLVHTFNKQPFARRLGELVAEGTRKAGDIHMQLVVEGFDVFLVGSVLNSLFAEGLFDDDPVYGGIGPQSNVKIPTGRAEAPVGA
jgi:radical SAM family RiPP maturation amino acid epimerase